MQKLKVGDTIQVISGSERSEKTPATKRGKVLKVDREAGRVTVEGLRLVKRHMRKTPQSPEGGIIEKPGTIALSNVQVVCAKCDKPTRVGIRKEGEASKRFCKQCDALID
ncbi:50S ribosomal protein L24 [Corallococcus praedator]|uniref:Large ribosomal subunit protein uL24 n=3 Tax=Corallococcus TaxID=83461 RepID=A0A3A8IQD8_9BACT|nr:MULTISPECIES: 50S ribosomal protein L24 [Corallococcus]RYZ33820.1 MAG: 50S ribosomal protein L24 [Myxococcaceae bacterium]MBE4752913.1 50S ribosomal protein L24 [Corallococcus soli]MCY1032528.1 50S ribosomal protein L24 [Corallococcus sp. BB11-1]MCY1041830.1 50S ribosomal protein L24 [Corallococcus sp. bb12-1]RKG82144.1 50S ribosomal protein L24 [Corallococcus terminator]